MDPTWCAQSTSSGSSASPSPTLVDNLRLCNDDNTDASDHLGTRDVFRDVVKGRKSWKTMKGGEMVWSPELEAALLEGLASYQPDDSRETRLLGRFPMRNRYISAYIYQKTGKHRTAKQVGSRLQQLRDTCGTKKLQHLLSPCRRPAQSIASRNFHYGSLQRYGLSCESASSSDGSAPASPISDSEAAWRHKSSHAVMYIDILPENHGSSSTQFSADGSHCDLSTTGSGSSVTADHPPRPIRNIDPTLTFTSRCNLDRTTRSVFQVYHSSKGFIHEEECSLQPSSGASEVEGTQFYTTSLVPSFWRTICNHSDPTEYTIKHQIEQDTPTPSVLFSATYKFRYPIEAASHRARLPESSSDFDMKAAHHPNVGHYSFECPPASDDAYGSLTEISYNANNEMSLYSEYNGSASLPSTPRSEASMSSGYGQSGDSLSPTSNQWLFPESSQMNYVCIPQLLSFTTDAF
uniref:TEA domain-containing protein n=1 Tax=Moniliophthora roreri TaxID=221103 RepID=A0A0W0FUD5_MONRR